MQTSSKTITDVKGITDLHVIHSHTGDISGGKNKRHTHTHTTPAPVVYAQQLAQADI